MTAPLNWRSQNQTWDQRIPLRPRPAVCFGGEACISISNPAFLASPLAGTDPDPHGELRDCPENRVLHYVDFKAPHRRCPDEMTVAW